MHSMHTELDPINHNLTKHSLSAIFNIHNMFRIITGASLLQWNIYSYSEEQPRP